MSVKCGCPPDYNPGFCCGDEDCVACWKQWIEENDGTIREAKWLLAAVDYINQMEFLL